MHDTPVMSAHQSAGYLNGVTKDRVRWQPPIAAHRVQRLALDKFHHNVELAVSLANLVDGADVWVGER
jgi:hypothetical protein